MGAVVLIVGAVVLVVAGNSGSCSFGSPLLIVVLIVEL